MNRWNHGRIVRHLAIRNVVTLSLPCGAEKSRIRCMKHWQIPLITFAALFVSLALAEDFKTTNGKEYKNATVTLVEPDGIMLRSKSGVSKVYFNEQIGRASCRERV